MLKAQQCLRCLHPPHNSQLLHPSLLSQARPRHLPTMAAGAGSLEALIASVQKELGGLISKPPLKENHLGRPPFRFIHDIVSEVTAATGYTEGLFQGPELDGKALTEKEDRAAYLEKIIAYVQRSLGQALEVKPSKILAGVEPENTNIFLLVSSVWCGVEEWGKEVGLLAQPVAVTKVAHSFTSLCLTSNAGSCKSGQAT